MDAIERSFEWPGRNASNSDRTEEHTERVIGVTRRVFLRSLPALATYLGLPRLAVAGDSQPALPRRVGVFLLARSSESRGGLEFRQGLRDAGYVEGRDVNLRAAKDLGLTIQQSILLCADEAIR